MDQPLKMPAFACAYPQVTKTCAQLEIYTIPDLYAKVLAVAKAAAADGLWVGQNKGLSQRNLATMLRGRKVEGATQFVNPWDAGRQSFHPLAVFVGLALGRFPTYLFGSPRELEALNRKIYEIPSPQRDHIRALMREAHNPLTGKKGISNAELMYLIFLEDPLEKIPNNPVARSAAYFDAAAGSAKGRTIHAFGRGGAGLPRGD